MQTTLVTIRTIVASKTAYWQNKRISHKHVKMEMEISNQYKQYKSIVGRSVWSISPLGLLVSMINNKDVLKITVVTKDAIYKSI
ncbi:MAG: hypothetical protein DHS20C13_28750 [Thermodesulfobacteriota bacterium]|nr:MAG: hypothetical protein DHS20C13_28750 [Thermodesulfobacteriota bacterium]